MPFPGSTLPLIDPFPYIKVNYVRMCIHDSERLVVKLPFYCCYFYFICSIFNILIKLWSFTNKMTEHSLDVTNDGFFLGSRRCSRSSRNGLHLPPAGWYHCVASCHSCWNSAIAPSRSSCWQSEVTLPFVDALLQLLPWKSCLFQC